LSTKIGGCERERTVHVGVRECGIAALASVSIQAAQSGLAGIKRAGSPRCFVDSEAQRTFVQKALSVVSSDGMVTTNIFASSATDQLLA
jgi:hypothetical protein